MGELSIDIAESAVRSPNKILVISSRGRVQESIDAQVVQVPGLAILHCETDEQYQAKITTVYSEIILAIVDTDSCDPKTADHLAGQGLPVIEVFKNPDDSPRISGAHVVASIESDDIDQMAGLSAVVEGIFDNRKTRVIVLHQNVKYRHYLTSLLSNRFYTVMQAADVAEGMELLSLYPETQVLLLDEAYARVGSVEVIDALRRNYPTDHLAIISLIAQRDAALVSALFESGSNDVIPTSTDDVEFLARLEQQVGVIRNFRKLKNSVFLDPLTQAYSMEYFREVGQKIFDSALRDNFSLGLAVVNIDNLREINQQHGAAVGDLVLCSLVTQLKSLLRSADFVVRREGDEFIALLSGVDQETFSDVLERTRSQLEESGAWFGRNRIPFTVTIGATSELGANLENMLTRADMALLQARKLGCNRIESI